MQFEKVLLFLSIAWVALRESSDGAGADGGVDLLLQKTALIITLFCNFLHMQQIIQHERDNSLKHWKIIKFIMRKMN